MTNKKKEFDYKKILKTFSKNYWAISTVILVAILLTILITNGVCKTSGAVIGTEEAGQKILDFANSQGANAELVGVNDDGQFYEVVLSIQGQEFPLYVTRDGKSFTQQLIPLTARVAQDTPQQPTPTEVPKSDRPLAELFIMTHCPYGTQAEKGFIAAMKTLQEVADVKIRYVHYFMHQPEETETPIQVCIREEQSEKYLNYLECFLEDGDSDRCLTETNMDKTKLQNCINSGNANRYYEEDSALSNQYGVGGSPTLIINGAESKAGRDSASYLAGICSAFNDTPEECNTELSSAAPNPGFGYSGSGSNTNAQC